MVYEYRMFPNTATKICDTQSTLRHGENALLPVITIKKKILLGVLYRHGSEEISTLKVLSHRDRALEFKYVKGGFSWIRLLLCKGKGIVPEYFKLICSLFDSTSSAAPIRFHYVGGCCDRTHDCCDSFIKFWFLKAHPLKRHDLSCI
jgi:hypothetical protein